MSAVQDAVKAALNEPLKLDIGCGKNKKAGFWGLDSIKFEGVDIVTDIRTKRWKLSGVPEALWPKLNVEGEESWEAMKEIQVSANRAVTFADNSVDEIHCSHVLEHLTNLGDKWERVNFFNEVFRILKPGASMSLIIPHWASQRYYGDPTHKEPFSEFGFYYLGKAWRAVNAPHTDVQYNPDGYSCDFIEHSVTWGYSLRQDIQVRNQEYQMFALTNFKEAAQDCIANVKKPIV